MIYWPCCCDANCRCVGCATLEISGIDSGAYLCDEVVQEAYNRTVVMWRQNNSTATPFDLLADPTDCDPDYTNYPGTKCKGESYACCQANYYDTPIEPIPIGGGYEVPGTEAGTDCFPAIVCASGTSVCTTKLTKPTQPTHHYYVDANGYVWLAIVSYEYDVDIEGLQPHIVIIYKSSAAINCATINAAEGVGTSFTMSQVCQGLAAESSQCAAETTPLIDVSGATITLKIYSNVSYCCETTDPCNDDEGACAADVGCGPCENGIASSRYLIEIEGVSGPGTCDPGDAGENYCTSLNGSYIVNHFFSTPVFPPAFAYCSWAACFDVDGGCYLTYPKLSIEFSIFYFSPTQSRLFVKATWTTACNPYGQASVTGVIVALVAEQGALASLFDRDCLGLNRQKIEIDPTFSTCTIAAGASVYVTAI